MIHPFSGLLANLFRRGRSASAPPRSRRPRLNVECLEDRLAPAVFNVNSLADLSIAAGVNSDGSIIGQGTTVTLRSAIQAANANSGAGGNTINLTLPGTYKITLAGAAGETDNLQGELSIFPTTPNGNLTIVNTSGGAAIVDGNHLNRVFDINAGATNNAATQFLVTMQGFTIENGDALDAANPDGPTSTGGGIRDQGNTSLTLNTMLFTNDVSSADGGGVVMENSVNIGTWVLTINNCMFTNNHAGDTGGGFDTDGTGTVVVNNSVFTGNTDVNQGAGIYIDTIAVGATFPGASMTLTGSTVSDNQATNTGVTASGGGISNAGNGTMTIVNSTIEGNFSGGSGGGFSDENNVGTLVVMNSFFLDNSAVADGGGIQEGGPSTTITNTAIQGNTASGTGGGLFLNGTNVSIQSSTISSNTAVGGGGGIEIQTTGTGASGTTITNSTITANSATGNAAAPTTANGGGIEAPATTFTGALTLLNDTINGNFATNGGGIFWGGTTGSVALENTIAAKNFAATGPDANNPAGAFTDTGGNLIGASGASSGNTGFTATTTQTGTVATPLDPVLGSLATNGGPVVGALGAQVVLQTEALLPGSPAIDKGVSASATTDERGFPRPDSTGSDTGLQDVGAFESNPLAGNAAFVQTLYLDLLHRLGDVTNPMDAEGWINGLNSGMFTHQAVAAAIAHSPEALGVVVDGLYLKILGRASDPGGRTGFVNFLESGGTVEQAITMMATSPEFNTLTGSNDTTFVQSLYARLLGRTATSLEVAGWLSALASMGRAGVANAFLHSSEFRSDGIEDLYGFPPASSTSVGGIFPDLLHRTAAPSSADINGFVMSGLDILNLEIAVSSSAEFNAQASTGMFF
jgi:hypothetical protein